VVPTGRQEEQLLRRDVKRFRGGLVFKAHRLCCPSTLGLRVITKKKRISRPGVAVAVDGSGGSGGFPFRILHPRPDGCHTLPTVPRLEGFRG
jgi:hypothetical protein